MTCHGRLLLLGFFGTLLSACGEPAAVRPPTASSGSPCAAVPSDQATFTLISEQSQASYSVQEKIFSQALQRTLRLLGRDNTAVGRTSTVTGAMQFRNITSTPTLSAAKITLDLRTLTSDNAIRDERIRNGWLESNRYPFATFAAQGVQVLARPHAEGQPVSFTLPGDMTIHDTTHPFVFQVSAAYSAGMMKGTASGHC